jgi:aminopeptidase N
MMAASDPALADRNLAIAISEEIPPEFGTSAAHDFVLTVATAGDQPEAAWEFYARNLPKIAAHLSAFGRAGRIASAAATFWNAAPLAQLDALMSANIPPDAAMLREKADERIRFRLALQARVVPDVDRWLAIAAP